jgi:tricorn protease
MKRFLAGVAIASACGLAAARPAAAIDLQDTRLLTQPAISARHVLFVYAGDLWICDLNGQNVRRLTSDAGAESNPVFSPDGKLVAFSGQYDGNTDVFVMPAEGGTPSRLTWHPGNDTVQAFTPDGTSVLFTSPRAAFNNRYNQLYTVPVKGGAEAALPIPHAYRATYAPDGKQLAYNPLSPAHLQWKNYRGGTVSKIHLYRASDHAVEKVPQPAGRANDVDPMWGGDAVYFRSDRNGEFNLFSYDTKSKAIVQLTKHEDFPVLNAAASATGDRIVYEQAGYLHLFDPKSRQSTRMKIGVAADLVELRPRFVKGPQYIRAASLSPSGARAAFEFRGEIVTVPAEKGDPRNLTNSVAAHDRSPAWSPDGRTIAFFSDASGEYALHLAPQDGKGETRKIALTGAGFYERPMWSPDSQKIAYVDNSWALYVLDVKAGTSKKVGQEPIYGPVRTTRTHWAPDSKWLAYTLNSSAAIQSVRVYSIDQDKSFPITDGLSEVSEPVFDKSGNYLFFFASTDAGPVKDWFAQSTADSRATQAIYVAVLRSDLPSPIAKESDEEKGTSAADEAKKAEEKKNPLPGPDTTTDVQRAAADKPAAGASAGDKPGADVKSEAAAAKKPVVVRIDFEGLPYRILDLPIPVGEYSSLQPGNEGQIYFLRTADAKSALQRFDLKTRKVETLLPEVTAYSITEDRKKLMYRLRENWSIVELKDKIDASAGRLSMASLEVPIDPKAEWAQIFSEAWRINRDYFYAPNFHGANWTAMREKYAAFLPDVVHRSDLNRVIQWMCSELAVGHHRGAGGDSRETASTVPGGLLGADYAIENGRYRFKKIYGGLNWNPELRAPLTEPGVNAKPGEYLLAVNGRDLRAPANVYSLFENTSGKLTDITLGPNADGAGSRTVQVVPIASEAALRNRDWVEGNLRKVEQATGGRVAYVYVPNTAGPGFTYFKRYFYPQANREAIIVDERFNGGGQVADYYIDLLRRPLVSYWATRYGQDLKTPAAGIHGPKVMITDETAGSGGDLLPFMFRQAKLGPIVGQRTWGGLVGVLGFPVLMDGGQITAPNLAIWTEEGFIVENEGVPPDIEVEQTPAEVIAGKDPQLERAIQIVMDELKKNPPKALMRPAYPVRTTLPTTGTGSR